MIDLNISLIRRMGAPAAPNDDGTPLPPMGFEPIRRVAFALDEAMQPGDTTDPADTDGEITPDDPTPNHMLHAPVRLMAVALQPGWMTGPDEPAMSGAAQASGLNAAAQMPDQTLRVEPVLARHTAVAPAPAEPSPPAPSPAAPAALVPSPPAPAASSTPNSPTKRVPQAGAFVAVPHKGPNSAAPTAVTPDTVKAPPPPPTSGRGAMMPPPPTIAPTVVAANEPQISAPAPDASPRATIHHQTDLRIMQPITIAAPLVNVAIPGLGWRDPARDVWRDAGKNPAISELSISPPPGLITANATAPVSTPSVAASITAQISAIISSTSPAGVIELRLTPVELGPVRIIMQAAAGEMTVSIIAENPQTLELMRRNSDMLLQEFRNLGHANVTFQFSGGGQGHDHRAHPMPTAQMIPDAPAIPAAINPLRITGDGLDLRL